MIEWLFVLLPVAAASGWWAARRSAEGNAAAGGAPDPAFFRGLNYLLEERPDKAIDVFLKLAEVDGETAETHLALGSLFRRRGEVDRAIRIHQSLVARANLGKEQRADALFELGQDYMRAGLFDRAEGLFGELVETKLHCARALAGLREIYQQEKDWGRCLEVAEQLQALTGEPTHAEMAHYHCELAREAMKTGDEQAAAKHLRAAQVADRQCVRATMLQAQMAMARGDAQAGATLYQQVAAQRPQFLPEILPALLDAYQQCGRTDILVELRQLYSHHPSPRLVLILAGAIQREEGDEAAVRFLTGYVSEYADLAGVERLLELQGQTPDEAAAQQAVLAVVRHLRRRQPGYRCEHCGFDARRLHWQCPSCKHWGSIKPVLPQPMGAAAKVAPDRPSA